MCSRWLHRQKCSKIKDGKRAETNMSHITRKCFHVNELVGVTPLRLHKQSLPVQGRVEAEQQC